MKSIPDFLGMGGFWSYVLNLCVGSIQGLLGSFVVPRMGKKLLHNRLGFTVAVSF